MTHAHEHPTGRAGGRRRPIRHGIPHLCGLELCLACAHVLNGERSILLAWNDGDGVAFSCGETDHDVDSVAGWATSHVFHLVDGDPALRVIHTLAAGDVVERDRAGSPWRRMRLPTSG